MYIKKRIKAFIIAFVICFMFTYSYMPVSAVYSDNIYYSTSDFSTVENEIQTQENNYKTKNVLPLYELFEERIKIRQYLIDNPVNLIADTVEFISEDNDGFEDCINWRQYNPEWASISLGESECFMGGYGCLVTSIAMLIKGSGIEIPINDFNPGTFADALNNNEAFGPTGCLDGEKIKNVIPGFKFSGNVYIKEKSKEEKISIISEYLSKGYYITLEVKGATPGNQHWVAVRYVENDDIVMIDPASDYTNVWEAYDFNNTSCFICFSVN